MGRRARCIGEGPIEVITTLKAGANTYVHRHPRDEMEAPAGSFAMPLCEWFKRAAVQRAHYLQNGIPFTVSQEIVDGDAGCAEPAVYVE